MILVRVDRSKCSSFIGSRLAAESAGQGGGVDGFAAAGEELPMEVGDVVGGVAGGSYGSQQVAGHYLLVYRKVGGPAVEVGVVVLVAVGGGQPHGDTSYAAVAQALDHPVDYRYHRGAARRQEVDPFVAAPSGAGGAPGVGEGMETVHRARHSRFVHALWFLVGFRVGHALGFLVGFRVGRALWLLVRFRPVVGGGLG